MARKNHVSETPATQFLRQHKVEFSEHVYDYVDKGGTAESSRQLHADALALARAGAGAIVLEGIPREAAAQITAALPIPTIGIGAGPACDGQILVFHDLVNLTFAPPAKFVRRYADASTLFRSAVEHYREDVEHHAFPSDAESYHLPLAARTTLQGDFDDSDAIVNQDALLDWEELSQA